LLNTTRQLGGSLGVAIFATLLTARVSFHSQVYNESIQPRSAEFSNVDSHLTNHIQHFAGSSHADAIKQSKIAIISSVNKQSFIQGIDDNFLVATGITLLVFIPLFFVKGKNMKPSSKPLKT
jgi:DHA2 family multidrug resistance protein